MTRVLAFSPYPNMAHMAYELALTSACQARGAEILHLLCDGIFSQCDVHWASSTGTPRPFDLCQKCQARAARLMQSSELPHEWLSKFVNASDRQRALEWAHALPLDQFMTATFDGYPIAHWVVSSVATEFRRYPPDLSNSFVINVFRNYLHSGALASLALTHVLDEWRPDVLVVVNGRQSLTRVAVELARARNLRFLTHDGPLRPWTRLVQTNAHCNEIEPIKEYLDAWAQIPLQKSELAATHAILTGRYYGWQPGIFSKPPVLGFRESAFGADMQQYDQVVGIFSSSTDESAGSSEWLGAFTNQAEWIRATCEIATQYPQVLWILRVHPNSGIRTYLPSGYGDAEFFASLFVCLPPNMRMIPPDSESSTYALMNLIDVGLVFHSTVGIEIAALGKPVLMVGRNYFVGMPHLQTLSHVTNYADALAHLLQSAPSREMRRYAYRYIYRFFMGMNFDFPAWVQPILQQSAFTPPSLTKLLDPLFDPLCAFILRGEPIYTPPPVNLMRVTADENVFFTELEALDEPYYDRVHASRANLWYGSTSLSEHAKQYTRQMPTPLRAPLEWFGRTLHNSFKQILRPQG